MNRTVRLLFLPLLALAVSFSWVSIARAQTLPELTQEQEDRIRANCITMKAAVNQLHASDALLRVNRGQIYESMASNLMDRFNTRLASNDLDNRGMITVSTNYRTALSTFRENYITYEQKLSQTLRIDCVEQPAAFYRATQEARTLRAVVHDDVQQLHEYIDDYRSAVNGFYINYERLSD